MALELKLVDDLPGQASPNVPAGGIPQFTAVVLDTAAGSGPFDMIAASATTAPILGINQSVGGSMLPGATSAPNVTAGESMAVRVLGISKAIAGGAITPGQFVAVNASGQLVAVASLNPATTATDSYVVGVAMSAATAAGDLFSVYLIPGLTTLVTA